MRDWVSTSGASLFPNPGLRNAPSRGQFFGCQHFEEGPVCGVIVLYLFSMHVSCLCFNNLQSAATFTNARPLSCQTVPTVPPLIDVPRRARTYTHSLAICRMCRFIGTECKARETPCTFRPGALLFDSSG